MVMDQGDRNEYTNLIKRKIRRKSAELIRTSLVVGQARAETNLINFMQTIQQGVAKLKQVKIDRVVERSEQLVEEHLSHHPEIIVGMLQKLFRSVAEHTDVEITAHPDDVVHIKAALSEGAYASARQVTLKEDDTFQRGSLIIKANKSIIDAHITTQLERAKTLLVQRLEERNGKTN